jgi:hypothetical protein
MGLSLSCPLADLDDVDSRFEAILVRSISFGGRDVMSPLRPVSFNGRDSVKTPSAEKENNVFGRCTVSSKTKDIVDQLPRSDGLSEKTHQSPLSDPKKHRNQAALKLQKVYKSFRTRRQLADCAVLVEQRWFVLVLLHAFLLRKVWTIHEDESIRLISFNFVPYSLGTKIDNLIWSHYLCSYVVFRVCLCFTRIKWIGFRSVCPNTVSIFV